MNLEFLNYRMTDVFVFSKQTITLSIVIDTFSSTYLEHIFETPTVSFKVQYNIQCEKNEGTYYQKIDGYDL